MLRQGFRHFWRVRARWCGGLLHRILQRDCTRFCSSPGVLIDVRNVVREAGFRYPVALTAAAWEKCVAVPLGVVC